MNVEQTVARVRKVLKANIKGLSELTVQVEPAREAGGNGGGPGGNKGFCSCLT